MTVNGNKRNQNKLLSIRDLRISFRSDGEWQAAVKGISFDVYRGETIGIVGESGSGKSVTCLSVMNLVDVPPAKINSGEILFYNEDGSIKDLLKLSEQEKIDYRGNDVSMIFQEPMTSLNPVFTCGNQVAETLLIHQQISKKEAREKTLKLFEKVELPDVERVFSAYPHQLSGGQKQRVMIAMAMACKPSLLIADEPTTALDVTVQQKILHLMEDLKNEMDSSILFVTHDLGVVAEIADRVIVMYRGEIVEEGTVANIFKNPKHPYTKSLLACRPPLEFKMRSLPIVSDFMDVQINPSNQKVEMISKDISVEDVLTDYKIDRIESNKRVQQLMQQEPILSVKNLQTHFISKRDFFGRPTKWIKAVDNVSFDVYPGETLGLVGESGCGKTTLGRSLLRLNKVTAGQVFFEGKDVLSLSMKELNRMRRDIQIIFQDPYSSLNPRMTIGNAIMEPMKYHQMYDSDKERKNKVIELLETVSLKEKHFYRYPHQFSGGQRQRICIARALGLKPKFIICDESVSALDVSVQAQVLNLLLSLRETFNFSYIFISHDLSVVKFMSDRMMVMNKGKIEEIGPADTIYKNPQTEYTRNLIEAIPKGIIS